MSTTCERCGKTLRTGFLSDAVECNGKMYCEDCFAQVIEEIKAEQSKQREEEAKQKQAEEAAKQAEELRRKNMTWQERKQEEKNRAQEIENVLLTTTNNIEGHPIEAYLGIHSVSVGINFDNAKAILDAEAQIYASLKQFAFDAGGNAVISIQFQYFSSYEKEITMSSPSHMIVAHGTIVRIK